MAMIPSLPQMMKGGNEMAADVELCNLAVAISRENHERCRPNHALSGLYRSS